MEHLSDNAPEAGRLRPSPAAGDFVPPAVFHDLRNMPPVEIQVPLSDGTGTAIFPKPEALFAFLGAFRENLKTADGLARSRETRRARKRFREHEAATVRNFGRVLGSVDDREFLGSLERIGSRLLQSSGFREDEFELYIYPSTSANAFLLRPQDDNSRRQKSGANRENRSDRNYDPEDPQSRVIFFSTGLLVSFKRFLERQSDTELRRSLEESGIRMDAATTAALKTAWRHPADKDATQYILNTFPPGAREEINRAFSQWQEASTPAEDDVAFILSHEIRHLSQQRKVSVGVIEQITTSRQEEYDADIGGISEIMAKAGFNPRCSLRVLKFLRSIDSPSLTHPSGTSRTAEAQRLIDDPDTPLSGLDREPQPVRLPVLTTMTEDLLAETRSARASDHLSALYQSGVRDASSFLLRAVLLRNMTEIGIAVNSAETEAGVEFLGKYLFCVGATMLNRLKGQKTDPRSERLSEELASASYDFERDDIETEMRILTRRRNGGFSDLAQCHSSTSFPQYDLRLQSWLSTGILLTHDPAQLPEALYERIDRVCWIGDASPEEEEEEVIPEFDWLAIGRSWLDGGEIPECVRTEVSLATSYISYHLQPDGLERELRHLHSSIAERYALDSPEGRKRWARDFFASLVIEYYPFTKSHDLFDPDGGMYASLAGPLIETVNENLSSGIKEEDRLNHARSIVLGLAFPGFFPPPSTEGPGIIEPLRPGEAEAVLECMPLLISDLRMENNGVLSPFMRENELFHNCSPQIHWVDRLCKERDQLFPEGIDTQVVERTIGRLCADFPEQRFFWMRLRALTCGVDAPLDIENCAGELRDLGQDENDLNAYVRYWRRAVSQGCSDEDKSEIRAAVIEHGQLNSYLKVFFLLETYKEILFQDNPERLACVEEMLSEEFPRPRPILDREKFLDFMNLLSRGGFRGVEFYYQIGYISQLCDDSARGLARLASRHLGGGCEMVFSEDSQKPRYGVSPFEECSHQGSFPLALEYGIFPSPLDFLEADQDELHKARGSVLQYMNRVEELGDRVEFAKALEFDGKLALLSLRRECESRNPELAELCLGSVSGFIEDPHSSERILKRRIRRWARDEQWEPEKICARFPASDLLCNLLLDCSQWQQDRLLEIVPHLRRAENAVKFADFDALDNRRFSWRMPNRLLDRVITREDIISGDAYHITTEDEARVDQESREQSFQEEDDLRIIPYESFRYFTVQKPGVDRAMLALFNIDPAVFLPANSSLEETTQRIGGLVPPGGFRDYLLECAFRRNLLALSGRDPAVDFIPRFHVLSKLQGENSLIKDDPYTIVIEDASTRISADEFERIVRGQTQDFLASVECVYPLIESRTLRQGIVRAMAAPLYPEGTPVPLPFILRYLPEPGVLRDHLLRQYLFYTPLGPEAISEAEALLSNRMLREGDVPAVDVLGLEGMRQAAEWSPVDAKVRYLSWLLGIGDEPEKLHDTAVRWGVHFEDTRASFYQLTSTEIRELLREMTLGSKGIFEPANPDDKQCMLDFVRSFLHSRLGPEHQKLKEVFLMIFEEFRPERRHALFSSLVESLSENASPSRDEFIVILLENCGPVGIKIGQLLANAPEVPRELRGKLKRLQSRARPFSTVGTAHRLKDAGIESKIASIDTLLASASMKQAHLGATTDGEAVIIKVLRPTIDKYIEDDLRAFEKVAERLSNGDGPISLPIPPHAFGQVRQQLIEESDLLLEAELSRLLGDDLAQRRTSTSFSFTVPIVRFASKEVIIEDPAAGEELSAIAARNDRESTRLYDRVSREVGLEFLREILTGEIFHADFHDGNVFFEAQSSTCSLIDPGAVGRVQPEFRTILNGILAGDSEKVTDAIIRLSDPPDADDISAPLRDRISNILDADEPFAEKVSRISYEILWHVQPGRDLRLLLKGLAATAPHLQRLVPSGDEIKLHGIGYFTRHIQSLVSLVGSDYRTWASALR